MNNNAEILNIHRNSFRANVFTCDPFRMIGLINVDIRYPYGVERVILAYYRSSGTNSGKSQGLWYPIVGIKLYSGAFREFTNYVNCVLRESTEDGQAERGWLAKSVFFLDDNKKLRGFSNGIHYEKLLEIGETLRYLYDHKEFIMIKEMDARYINSTLSLNKILFDNKCTQRHNFELLLEDIYINI